MYFFVYIKKNVVSLQQNLVNRNTKFTRILINPNTFINILEIDNLLQGSRNRIPLWMFGLLY